MDGQEYGVKMIRAHGLSRVPGQQEKKAGRSPGSQIKEFYEEPKEALPKRPLASDCPAIITEVFFLSQHFCAAEAFAEAGTPPDGREFGRTFVR